MHRPFRATFLVASLFFCAVASVAGTSEVLEQARKLLAQDDGRAAVELLESTLPDASAAERAALLTELRRAYEAAARQAEAAGQARQAEAYRDNLRILERSPAPSAVQSVQDNGSHPPAHELVDAVGSHVIVVPTPLTTGPSRSPKVIDPARPTEPSAPTEPQPKAVPLADDAISGLASADAAFRARRYDEAGRLYAALARARQLPASRRDHWAYCRCAEVVGRINANPRTAAEWASINGEIRAIRALSPQNWYGEYLRNLAAERAAASGHSAKPQTEQTPKDELPVVIRGAAAEEAPASSPHRPAPPAVSQPGQSVGNWQTLMTPNFRILHADPALAERVARLAESTRQDQARRWGSSAARGTWSPRCDIYLYSTAAVFSRMTGQPENSPGFSTMGMMDGRIVARRLNLRADHPNLLNAIVPHEVTHVVLADLFPAQQIPRWADEGMAVLSEPVPEQDQRASDLAEPLASGRLFKVADLMAMDYPDGKYWGLYYAESVSLTRFLVESGTPAQFVDFLQSSQRGGAEAQLRRVYKIDGFADLQSRWVAYARSAPAVARAGKDNAAQPT